MSLSDAIKEAENKWIVQQLCDTSIPGLALWGRWDRISKHPCVTFDIIQKYPKFQWNWNSISKSNPNITWDIIEKHPNMPWHWSEISGNPIITWDIIQKNPNKPWNWKYFSENPSITWEIIKEYPDRPWDWWTLSLKPNIPWDLVGAHMDKNWNWCHLSESSDIDWNLVRKYPTKRWDYHKLVKHTSLPWDIIQSKINIGMLLSHWDWIQLSKHSCVTWEIVTANPSSPWDWHELSQNPNMTWDIVKANLHKPWILNVIKLDNILCLPKENELDCAKKFFAARKIQKAFKEAYTNPSFKLCQKRLRNEFDNMDDDLTLYPYFKKKFIAKSNDSKLNPNVIEATAIVASGSLLGIFILLLRNLFGIGDNDDAIKMKRV